LSVPVSFLEACGPVCARPDAAAPHTIRRYCTTTNLQLCEIQRFRDSEARGFRGQRSK
jgi:hypothetical protein